jgi:hypothetical protein
MNFNDKFMRNGLTIILSGFTGVLISMPALFSMHPVIGLPICGLFALAGARIGYKRQESDGFFYFTLVCSLILVSLLLYVSFNAQQHSTLPQ